MRRAIILSYISLACFPLLECEAFSISQNSITQIYIYQQKITPKCGLYALYIFFDRNKKNKKNNWNISKNKRKLFIKDKKTKKKIQKFKKLQKQVKVIKHILILSIVLFIFSYYTLLKDHLTLSPPHLEFRNFF